MVILCGIKPGRLGTGTVMSYLVRTAATLNGPPVRFIFGAWGDNSFFKSLSRGRVLSSFPLMFQRVRDKKDLFLAMKDSAVINDRTLVIVHPQSLGFRNCMELIERRPGQSWMFLMDSGFFCIRSYNHIPGENTPCLRCLGGDLSNIKRYGCKPFPVNDAYAVEFVKRLKGYVTSNHVNILTQTDTQAGLARSHFGKNALVKTCGIWGEEWDSNVDEMRSAGEDKSLVKSGFDVVFHGSFIHAKGAAWAISVAEQCQGLQFLFPFVPSGSLSGRIVSRLLNTKVRGNMHFVPMSWNSGLKDAVEGAKIVLVPSLWSAPVEGALVKSLALSSAVAVVDNPTSFSNEIPDTLLFRLPSDKTEAAKSLRKLVDSEWMPGLEARKKWYHDFAGSNQRFFERIIEYSDGLR